MLRSENGEKKMLSTARNFSLTQENETPIYDAFKVFRTSEWESLKSEGICTSH